MKRFVIILVIAILSFVTIVGCSTDVCKNDDYEVTAFGIEHHLSFTEAVELSDVIVIATYASSDKYNEQLRSQFIVTEVLRGDIYEDVIYIFDSIGYATVFDSDLSYETGNNAYSANEQYLLVLSRTDSLFLDFPHHAIISRLFIPVDDIERSTMYDEPLSEIASIRSTSDIRSVIRNAKVVNTEEGQRYTSAIDFPTIISESDYVLEVEIIDIYVEGVTANSNTYYCRVIKNLRGDALNKIEDSEEILVSFIMGSVEIGETYVIMINKVGRHSVVYTQSSFRSVISMDDKEALVEIESMLS